MEERSPSGHLTHGGRVTHEQDEEQRMTDVLTAAMSEQAGPAAFVTGKTIESAVITPGESKLRFTDGSGLTLLGGALQYHAQIDSLPGPERTDIAGELE